MSTCDKLVDVGRRQFLRGGAVAAVGSAAAVVMPAEATARPAAARVEYPSTWLGNISNLKVDQLMEITYPDKDSPGVLLKLGTPVTGGVGPDKDIVAFSTLCPHRGFGLVYRQDDKSLNCPAHYSRFDCEKGGMQIIGQATQNLPQFALRVDDKGNIYAEGVDELIYGRLSNVL
jgi:arsenite oxidase small subunit